MFTLRRLISRAGLVLSATALLTHLSIANAGFSADIEIFAATDFVFSDGVSGTFSKKVGGVDSVTDYLPDGSHTGTDPFQEGYLTDIGDGTGFTGSASADDDDNAFFEAGLDSFLYITNLSLTDTYDVTVKLDYSNLVHALAPDAAGDVSDDAYSDSELVLYSSNDGFVTLDENFYSDLVSDSFFGDEVGGVATGGFGEELSESGFELFTFTLGASDFIDLQLSWFMEGGNLVGDDTGTVIADLSAFLSVYSVDLVPVPTPIPATFFLIGLGLALLPLQRRMRALLGK